jgi:endonuclease/exonuclease/phosphatase family metal-dependent hydrolase
MAKHLLRRLTKNLFIAANLVFSLLFILGACLKYFNPGNWWFLGLLPFLLPFLLVIHIIFIFFWLFFKPGWMVLSILTLLAGWPAITSMIGLNFNTEFALKKNAGNIRVMSWNVEQFNIQHYKDKPEVKVEMLDLINKYDPDIACFQEVVAGENKKGVNYFPEILDKLRFKDYFYSYAIKDDFDQYHHFGTIIFSRLPIIRKQTFVNNPNDYNSTFQYIDVLAGKDTLRIFNIHLQSLKFTKENLSYLDKANLKSDSTLSESKSIISKMKTGFLKRSVQADFIKDAILDSPYPVIVCGDFNDVPNSYAYEKIGDGLQDAFVTKGYGISRTFSGISPTLRIDNIFVDRSLNVIQFIRIKKLLSDHFPIVTDISLVHENE